MNETKERILAIALYYFIKKPYAEVTMNEILKASDMSKGGFYHHFESKEALYHEVIDHFILRTFIQEYGHFMSNPYDLPLREFIPAYIDSTLKHLVELTDTGFGKFKLKMKEVNLYMLMFDMMKHYKGFEKVIEEHHESEVNMFRILIDKAKEKGEIKQELDSLSLAGTIHTLMHGIGVLALFDEKMENLEVQIKSHFDNFYRLIEA